MLLNDNGGVWQKHNDWIEGLTGPVQIKSLVNNQEAKLVEAKADNLWKVSPTALSLAKSHGLDGDHLSAENSIAIPIEILGMH